MNKLSNKRIFLAGGTGFFGKWLLELFQGLETELVVLSRNPDLFVRQFPMAGTNSKITLIRGDVRDFIFPSGHFDYVIHAATEASVKLDQENPDEMRSVIIDGTRRVLEFSKHAGVERLLYVSSGAVYGVQPPELSHIPETFPCNPVTAYGKGKLLAEQMCIKSGIETVIARPFAFVGPWLPLDTHFAIGNFIGNCLRGEPIEIKGDGTPLRSYMYGSDLADWLLAMLLRGESARAYNVGSDEAISISDLAHLVRECAGTKNEIFVRGTKIEGALPPRYVPSVDRAETELSLYRRGALPDAIRRTIDWHRNADV
ncbi:MAG: NAD(P)-dependent oxidoreductase [Verrucomicrobia bacterium]|nr:NAD(P)-dependent oxidoreductase [Verrucomicrobiota bacterium]